MDYSLTKLSIKSNDGKLLTQLYTNKLNTSHTCAQIVLKVCPMGSYDLALRYALHPRLISPRVPNQEDNPFADYGFNPWIELAPGNHLFPLTEDERPDLTSILEEKYQQYNQFMVITGFPLIPFMNLTDEVLRIIDEKVKTSSNPFIASLKMHYYNDQYLIKSL